jgi:5,10-methylene-tetrahydrofolate dehydrogenase/methenyl tetrahydrofolate cyclohydrolase
LLDRLKELSERYGFEMVFVQLTVTSGRNEIQTEIQKLNKDNSVVGILLLVTHSFLFNELNLDV